MFQIDETSAAYQHGYKQGFTGRDFRNPCTGNPLGTHNHYFGFLKGEADRTGVGYDWRSQVSA
jgi:ribosome modulation factor